MTQNNEIIPLHDYQEYAKNFIMKQPYCGLFLEMGLGKTGIVLEALYEMNPNYHVLIIAPKTIAKVTWTNEIEKWNMPLRTRSMVVNEKGKQLNKAAKEKLWEEIPNTEPTIWFINRDQIPSLVEHFDGKYRKWPFPFVVVDESQSFKSGTSQRFKALKKIRPYIQNMVLLSGSPTPQGLEDIWSQIYLLDKGERLGTYYTQFRNRYFVPTHELRPGVFNWVPRHNSEKEIYSKISDIVISMKNKNNIKLPDVTYNQVLVHMNDNEFKIYKKMLNDKVIEFSDGTSTDASNAGVLSIRLSQMASGAIYKEKGKDDYELIHKRKLEMCQYIIDNTDDNVIIAYRFHSDRDMLFNYFEENPIKINGKPVKPVEFDGTPEMEKEWNTGKIKIMLLQPASNGAGVNLQKGGHTLIWYSLPWSLEQYEQTNTRIYRQGQNNPVIIHQLMTDKTIDKRILFALQKKDLSQQALINAVEVTLQEVQASTKKNSTSRITKTEDALNTSSIKKTNSAYTENIDFK